MEKYIAQLLEDIAAARENLPQPWQEEKVDIWDWLPEEEDRRQATHKTVEEWTGIRQIQLPPAERLTPEQIHALFAALCKLLDDINCSFITQIRVPEELQYRTLRRMWPQEHAWLQWHQNFFDFCEEGQPHGSCELGVAYCHCKFFAEMFGDMEEEEEWTEEDEEAFWEDYLRRKRRRRDDW